MSETVKCYRVLRDGMRVGESVRDFGDFMPEAAEFDGFTLRSLLSSNSVELVYVEKQAVDEWRVEQDARDLRRVEAAANGDVYNPDAELDEIEDDEVVPEIVEPHVTAKKIAPKRKVTKKKVTVKKTEKEHGNGKRLAEENV